MIGDGSKCGKGLTRVCRDSPSMHLCPGERLGAKLPETIRLRALQQVSVEPLSIQ
jgi:hypothetical protein